MEPGVKRHEPEEVCMEVVVLVVVIVVVVVE